MWTGDLLPGEDDTDYLAALVGASDHARSSWTGLIERVGDPVDWLRQDTQGRKRLLPMLHVSAVRNDLPMTPAFRDHLAAALVRDRRRHTRYADIAAEAIGLVADACPSLLLVKGAALAETAYDEPALRHCHDLDLVLTQNEIAAAASNFRSHDYRVESPLGCGTVTAHHPSGMPVLLHSRMFRMVAAERDLVLRAGTVERDLFGQGVTIPDRETALAHVLVHAGRSLARRHFRWVCDASVIIANTPELNWARVVELAENARAVPATKAQLSWLKTRMQLAIPDDAIARLPTRHRARDRSVFIAGLAGEGRVSRKEIMAAGMGQARLDLAKLAFKQRVPVRVKRSCNAVRSRRPQPI